MSQVQIRFIIALVKTMLLALCLMLLPRPATGGGDVRTSDIAGTGDGDSPRIETPVRRLDGRTLSPEFIAATIELSYGLGWGLFDTPHGRAFFKEGHDDGWENYMVAFPEAGIGIAILTNSSNGESIFKALLAELIGDVWTPWQWNNYVPYDAR